MDFFDLEVKFLTVITYLDGQISTFLLKNQVVKTMMGQNGQKGQQKAPKSPVGKFWSDS